MSEKKKEIPLEEGLFFHDLMNQIHGISLYLEHKISQAQKISVDESKEVLREVKVVRKLVQQHFQFRHVENVKGDFLTFTELRPYILSILKHQMPQVDIREVLEIYEESSDAMIDAPKFFRIITNIAKNMADNTTGGMKISLESTSAGICVLAQNTYRGQENSLAKSGGQGLESTRRLVQELDGSFSSLGEDGIWRTQIFLPNLNIVKIAA